MTSRQSRFNNYEDDNERNDPPSPYGSQPPVRQQFAQDQQQYQQGGYPQYPYAGQQGQGQFYDPRYHAAQGYGAVGGHGQAQAPTAHLRAPPNDPRFYPQPQGQLVGYAQPPPSAPRSYPQPQGQLAGYAQPPPSAPRHAPPLHARPSDPPAYTAEPPDYTRTHVGDPRLATTFGQGPEHGEGQYPMANRSNAASRRGIVPDAMNPEFQGRVTEHWDRREEIGHERNRAAIAEESQNLAVAKAVKDTSRKSIAMQMAEPEAEANLTAQEEARRLRLRQQQRAWQQQQRGYRPSTSAGGSGQMEVTEYPATGEEVEEETATGYEDDSQSFYIQGSDYSGPGPSTRYR